MVCYCRNASALARDANLLYAFFVSFGVDCMYHSFIVRIHRVCYFMFAPAIWLMHAAHCTMFGMCCRIAKPLAMYNIVLIANCIAVIVVVCTHTVLWNNCVTL